MIVSSFFLFFLPTMYGKDVKIFNFETQADTAILNVSTSKELSATFTICISNLVKKNRFANVIQVQDSEEERWFTLSHFMENKQDANEKSRLFAWLRVGKKFSVRLGSIGQHGMPAWIFSCLRVNTSSGTLTFKSNGNLVAENMFSEHFLNFDKVPKRLTNQLRVGRIQYGSTTDYLSSVGNINVFDDSADFDSLNCSSAGNYLSMEEMKWTAVKSENGTASYEEMKSTDVICGSSALNLAVPAEISYGESVKYCRSLGGGQMYDARTETDISFMYDFFRAMITKKNVWVPFTDLKTEGTWVFEYEQSSPVNLPWVAGQPNGGTGQNCAHTTSSSPGLLVDNYCDYLKPFVCVFPTRPTLKLKGLCDSSKLDPIYSPVNADQAFSYNGHLYSDIVYNSSTKEWNLFRSGKLMATSSAAASSLVLGTRTWQVMADSGCENNNEYTTELNLSFCTYEQFNCMDGSCISLTRRCDGKQDCDDGSDEESCEMVIMHPAYNKRISPPSPHSTSATSKTQLNITLDIKQVLDIQEIEGRFEVKTHIKVEWFDPQLKFYNLKPDVYLNTLGGEEFNKIWKPKLIFDNIKEIDSLSHYKEDRIRIDATLYEFINTHYSELRNGRIFDGTRNHLVLEKYISTLFICNFDMSWYPFDTQVCHMNITVLDEDSNYVEFLPKDLILSIPNDLVSYSIKCMRMVSEEIDGRTGVSVSISLARSMTTFLLTVFIPTLALDVIGHLTNFFKDDDFDIKLTLNITVTLVLSNMFIGINASLPTTNNLKHIELWLIFSMLLPFVEILIQTYIEWQLNKAKRTKVANAEQLENSTKEKPSNKKVKAAKYILHGVKPVIVIIFIAVFWVIGLNEKYSHTCLVDHTS